MKNNSSKLLFSLLFAAFALASPLRADGYKGSKAYVCPESGKVFHSDKDCSVLKDCSSTVIATTAKLARQQGYTYCNTCNQGLLAKTQAKEQKRQEQKQQRAQKAEKRKADQAKRAEKDKLKKEKKAAAQQKRLENQKKKQEKAIQKAQRNADKAQRKLEKQKQKASASE